MSMVVVLKIGQPGGATKGVVRARSAVTVAATDGGLDDMAECGVCECTGRRGQRDLGGLCLYTSLYPATRQSGRGGAHNCITVQSS